MKIINITIFFVLQLATVIQGWQQQMNYHSLNSAFVEPSVNLQSVLEGKTIISLFNATFSWKIENLQFFDFGDVEMPNTLQGPHLFAIDRTNEAKIYGIDFALIPSFEGDSNEDVPTNYEIKCTFTNDFPFSAAYFFVINETEHEGAVISSSLLNGTENLRIFVKAFFSSTKQFKASTTSLMLSLQYDNNPKSLASDLIKLFESDSDSQIIIECAGEEIVAYKSIMQARSSVFKEILSNGTYRIRIKGFSAKIVKKSIEFCNSELIENLEGKELNVFAMAHEYKIDSLMAYSSKAIIENVNNENAVEKYKFAEFYHYEPLKTWLLNYIIQNLSEISTFKSLDPKMYEPILKELLRQKNII